MKIVPVNEAGPNRQGTLVCINKSEIVKILGFEPNINDDTEKVRWSWGFEVDGVYCAIWDYNRSKDFSTYGPTEIFIDLFGADRVLP